MHIDLSQLKQQIKSLENESVLVGVLSPTIKSAQPDFNRGLTTMSAPSSQGGQAFTGMTSTKRRYIKTKGRNKNISLRKLAFILDAKKGIFSDVMINPNNSDLINVAQEFAILNKTTQDIRRLENAAKSLVRNPILRKDYNPNSAKWVEKKGFNHYAFCTGTLFKNITAVYRKW